MYKRILLPTDGSILSRQAVAGGVLLAKHAGASVVGIHVVPVPHADQLEAWMHHDPHYAERRQALFEKFGDEYLAFIANCALAKEIPAVCRKAIASEPWQAIVAAADQEDCDLIYMASHGWKRGEAQLLGSQTVKVLHYSKVPVLVHKPARERSDAERR